MKKNALFLMSVLIPIVALATESVSIQGGKYRPLYLKKDTPMIAVKPFRLDKTAVTNAEFARFVAANPQWQRGRVAKKMAENNYLQHWVKSGKGYAPKTGTAQHPVTNVSWFAAHAYCSAQGKRLPTIDEWEYAAMSSTLLKDGSKDVDYNRVILDWYAEGNRKGLRNVGLGKPNYWGAYDMHGLIWEWTEDFNSSLLNAATANDSLFCGGGTANSTDPSNYAAFMRYGIRTSLKAPFVLNNLGFRCAE